MHMLFELLSTLACEFNKKNCTWSCFSSFIYSFPASSRWSACSNCKHQDAKVNLDFDEKRLCLEKLKMLLCSYFTPSSWGLRIIGHFISFLQVTNHLKEFAKDINVRVIPIVGGMSAEKQEWLLKARPELIVGTPGRLWELISEGEKHLVEVRSEKNFI